MSVRLCEVPKFRLALGRTRTTSTRVLDLLRQAKKPVLIGGHGVWWSGAERQLEAVGHTLNIPIFNIPYHQKLLGEESEAYMGLADLHQYAPSKFALQEADVALMVGGRLDNQMNFGNPPFFPEALPLVCINGSPEELELNRAADHTLLSDPGAFFEALLASHTAGELSFDRPWFEENRRQRGLWVEQMQQDTEQEAAGDPRLHPLQLALDVQSAMGLEDWLVIDGGNTHFWSEIAINMAGWCGQKLKGILHPGAFSMGGWGFLRAGRQAQAPSRPRGGDQRGRRIPLRRTQHRGDLSGKRANHRGH